MISRLSRWAPLLGVLYGVLLAAVIVSMPPPPSVDASAAKIMSYYNGHRGALQVQVYLLAYCGIALVAYFGVLTGYLRRHGADTLARVGFAGAMIMATGFGIGAGSGVLVSHKTVPVTAANAQLLNLLNDDLPFVTLALGGVLALISIGIAVLSTKSLPAWVGWVAIIAGVASGVGTFISFIAIMLGGLWSIAGSIVLYRRMSTMPTQITLPADAAPEIPTQSAPAEPNVRLQT